MVFDKNGNMVVSDRPNHIGLGHELAHAIDDLTFGLNRKIWFKLKNKIVYTSEIDAIRIENAIRKEHNLPYRAGYGVTKLKSGEYIPIEAGIIYKKPSEVDNRFIQWTFLIKTILL